MTTPTTITISINPSYPAFAALPQEQFVKVSVGLGPSGMNKNFFSYQGYATNFQSMGDAGVNQAALMVSARRPLTFSRDEFAVFGNITTTDYSACRLATLLSDLVLKGAVLVTDNSTGTPLTPDQILTFTP